MKLLIEWSNVRKLTIIALSIFLTSGCTTPQESRFIGFRDTCEDSNVLPCLYMDEGEWYIVEDWQPLRRTEIVECESKRGGPEYPCLVYKDNINWPYVVITSED